MTIAYKEARETKYWIRLLIDTKYSEYDLAGSLLEECEELCKIISKIQTTTRENNNL